MFVMLARQPQKREIVFFKISSHNLFYLINYKIAQAQMERKPFVGVNVF